METSKTFGIIALSAPSLEEGLEQLKKLLKNNSVKALGQIADDILTKNEYYHPERHPHRIAVIGNNAQDILQKINQGTYHYGEVNPGTAPPKLCTLFGGFGTLYRRMGYSLYQSIPEYKQFIDQVDEKMKNKTSSSIHSALYDIGKDHEETLMDNVGFAAIATISTTLGLIKVWETWGLKPDMVLGHSIGEYSASVMAKICTPLDALRPIDVFSSPSARMEGDGMTVVLGEEKKAIDIINEWKEDGKEWLELTSRNSPVQTVVGGTKGALKWFHGRCNEKGLMCVPLPGGKSFHSRGIDSFLPALKEGVKDIKHEKPMSTYISSLTGKVLDEIDYQYWLKHFRGTVNFTDAVETAVIGEGATIFLEIGPGKTLLSLVKQWQNNTNRKEEKLEYLTTIVSGQDETETILTSLAKLYVRNFNFDWKAVTRISSHL